MPLNPEIVKNLQEISRSCNNVLGIYNDFLGRLEALCLQISLKTQGDVNIIVDRGNPGGFNECKLSFFQEEFLISFKLNYGKKSYVYFYKRRFDYKINSMGQVQHVATFELDNVGAFTINENGFDIEEFCDLLIAEIFNQIIK